MHQSSWNTRTDLLHLVPSRLQQVFLEQNGVRYPQIRAFQGEVADVALDRMASEEQVTEVVLGAAVG